MTELTLLLGGNLAVTSVDQGRHGGGQLATPPVELLGLVHGEDGNRAFVAPVYRDKAALGRPAFDDVDLIPFLAVPGELQTASVLVRPEIGDGALCRRVTAEQGRGGNG